MRLTKPLDGHTRAHCFQPSDVRDAATETIQAFMGLQSLRDYLPPWLGGEHDSCPQPLLWMLQALKAATEAYLEASLSIAEVVFPFPISDTCLDAVRSAFSSLSLQMPLSKQTPAGILAARANGIGGQCNFTTARIYDESSIQSQSGRDDDPSAQIILTVDYSEAALTALLVFEECNIFEYRRVLHDTNLGADALSKVPPDARQDDLVRALRRITALPLEDGGNGAEIHYISELVLLGELAWDRTLRDSLCQVLEEQSHPGKYHHVTVLQRDPCTTKTLVNPLFAASRGVAQDCWERLDFSDQNIATKSLL